MLRNKKTLIPLTVLSLLLFVIALFLIIDSLSPVVSKDEWQSTPELALAREVEYGANYIDANNTTKTADVLQVKLMLDIVEIEGANTAYAIFLSKMDIFTVAKLTKDPATGNQNITAHCFMKRIFPIPITSTIRKKPSARFGKNILKISKPAVFLA